MKIDFPRTYKNSALGCKFFKFFRIRAITEFKRDSLLYWGLLQICLVFSASGYSTVIPVASIVEIIVSDNGPGIPTDILSKVFDPFFTTSEPSQGVGLGLYIVQEILHEHDGCLAIVSKIDLRSGSKTDYILNFKLDSDKESSDEINKYIKDYTKESMMLNVTAMDKGKILNFSFNLTMK